MGVFRDYLNEARDSSVPAEFRIAIGQLKRMYNTGEVPELKELQKDAEMIAKKNHLDAKKFVEFAMKQYGLNESEDLTEANKTQEKVEKLLGKPSSILANLKIWKFSDESYITVDEGKSKIGYWTKSKNLVKEFKNIEELKSYLEKSKLLNESAVGKPGRTTVKDAEDHIDDELVAEFKKIIKKLGGKMVAKVLLDKLSTKAEIKDEIDHIEDLIDNSNY